MAAAGEDADDQRDRREREQQQKENLREDHRERERTDQKPRAELPGEHDDREQQPLVLAALAHRFSGGLIRRPKRIAAVVLRGVGFGEL